MAYEKGSKPEGGFKRRGPARRRKKFAYSVVKKITKSITKTLQN